MVMKSGQWDGYQLDHRLLINRYQSRKEDTSYNILLEKPKLNVLRAIVSIPHLAMKFPSSHGEIGIVKADKEDAHECYVKSYNMVREKNNKASITSINTVSASWANLDP
ncbi:hypothetical protein JHK87_006742 [Glycine soja]|nr:hypothetical protein JHK87_006742 [Glycine soja]